MGCVVDFSGHRCMTCMILLVPPEVDKQFIISEMEYEPVNMSANSSVTFNVSHVIPCVLEFFNFSFCVFKQNNQQAT